MMKRLASTILLLFFFISTVTSAETFFQLLNQKQGLSGQHVLQMTQLEDGRMVVDTESDVCLWNGRQFKAIHKDSTDYAPLPGYMEFTRLFLDRHGRLWVKEYLQKVACLDLRTLRFIPDCTRLLGYPDDFYADTHGTLWTVRDSMVVREDGSLTLSLPMDCGRVQEVQTDSLRGYIFTSNGAVTVYDMKNGRRLASYVAYDASVASSLSRFSLVVRDSDGMFYQIRFGQGHAVLLSFNPQTCQWKKFLDVEYSLHTLIVSPDRKLYVTCSEGYWVINLDTGEQHLLTQLYLPDGSIVHTGYNTICQDRDGGIWLGSYNQGVLYASSNVRLFDTPHHWWPWLVTVLILLSIAGYVLWLRRKRTVPPTSPVMEDTTFSPQEKAFIDKVTSLVEQNLANTNYSVEQLAEELCMERSGLYKKLTPLIGMSPIAFIRSVRLEHAASLLKKGTYSVTSISEMTGFSSPQYFNRCFQKQYGCRPSEYREGKASQSSLCDTET